MHSHEFANYRMRLHRSRTVEFGATHVLTESVAAVSVVLSEVFIASNFEEFVPLRAEIKRAIDDARFARAIDLNDNAADPRSAMQRSRAWVRKAEGLVLLVGEKYGSIPDGQQHSYTHL